MIHTIFHNRMYRITAIIFAVAFVICGIAWMRFFVAALTNPSPVRYVEFLTADGPRTTLLQRCAGPSFAENDSVWRFCAYSQDSLTVEGADEWGLVRFDLDQGQAVMRWPLPEDPTAQILALAQSPDRTLALVWGRPDLAAVYIALPDGGVQAIGVPSGVPDRVAGLAWAGKTLELVTGDESVGPGSGRVTISAFRTGVWQETRTVVPPDACTEGTICAFQFAHRDDDGWSLLYAAAPVEDPAAQVDFLLAAEDGTSSVIDSIPLADLDPGQITRDETGRLVRLGGLFDRAPGNVINWSLDAAPFMLHDGTWQRVAAPKPDVSFYFSDYRLGPDGLRWIPGLRYPERGWLVDQWLTLTSSGNGVALTPFDGEPGPILTTNTTFVRQGGAQTSLLPAADGGYWVLGPNGAYIKADASLRRADGLNIIERIERAFDNFGDLKAYNDSFYRERELLKMAAFPMVLLSLPAGYLLVFFVRQVRKDARMWVLLLAQVSGIYLILATVFMWWFWEVTSNF